MRFTTFNRFITGCRVPLVAVPKFRRRWVVEVPSGWCLTAARLEVPEKACCGLRRSRFQPKQARGVFNVEVPLGASVPEMIPRLLQRTTSDADEVRELFGSKPAESFCNVSGWGARGVANLIAEVVVSRGRAGFERSHHAVRRGSCQAIRSQKSPYAGHGDTTSMDSAIHVHSRFASIHPKRRRICSNPSS
jgi:hypothetical protein